MQQNTGITLEQAFAQALAHHEAGRLAEAEGIYRLILQQVPGHSDSLHLLGVMACQVKQYGAAAELIEKAIAIQPRAPAYHSNLGEAYRNVGRTEAALAAYRRAIALDRTFGDAYLNLSVCLLLENRGAEAVEVVQTAVGFLPGSAGLWRQLGDLLIKERRLEEAIEAYGRALKLDPRLVAARFNLGMALLAVGRPAEAAQALRAVLAMTPEDVAAWMGLADACVRHGNLTEALAAYRAVIEREPGHAGAHGGLGNLWRMADQVDESIRAFRRAVELKPEDATIAANLALALRDYGELAETVRMLRAIVAREPKSPQLRSSLIFTLYLLPEVTPQEIATEQRAWNEIHVRPVAIAPHVNERSPRRRLKIGYVSADLRRHPVGRFMEPLFERHDRGAVEVFAYSAALRADAETEGLKGKVDQWRTVTGMTDEELAAQIRKDQIDVLIDLNMHAVDNRLPAFAGKPAPVQMTYLAYCAGTGLETIDYRLTDRWIDSETGGPEPAFEKPLRLETYWCYAPHPEAGEVEPGPAAEGGGVTFGSFSYYAKINEPMLETWAALLKDVPGSRLMLHVVAGSRQAVVQDFFEKRGVGGERLVLVPRVLEGPYFKQYGLVDIALDTHPFAGGTTTCDALWMGVPVVTLAGKQTVSRGGVSILSTLGLPEWIAHTPEEYRRVAAGLAADRAHLVEMRRSLRQRMQESLLMDSTRFARSMESAFREAWRTWCAAGG